MFKRLRADIRAAKKNDPAARSKFEIWLTYSGVHALSWHRWANFLYRIKLKLLARITSQFAKFLTGIEIHPAAKIAGGVFIDHGTGVVIGETAEIEEGVVIKNSVVLPDTYIAKDIVLDYQVVDKHSKLLHCKELIASADEPGYVKRGDTL